MPGQHRCRGFIGQLGPMVSSVPYLMKKVCGDLATPVVDLSPVSGGSDGHDDSQKS